MQYRNVGLPLSGATEPLPHAIRASTGSSWPILVLTALWLFVTYIILDLNASIYETTILIAILTTLLIPIAVLQIRRELDIFEPIVFANLSLASMFIGRPIFDISTATWNRYSFGTFVAVRPGFDLMLFYALLGILAFQVGYLSPVPHKLNRRMPTLCGGIDISKSLQVSVFLFVIGVVLFEEYVRQSGGIGFLTAYLTSRALGGIYSFKAASGYLSIGPLFWPPAALISFASWLKSRRRAHLFISVMIFACFFISLLGGVGRSYAIQGLLGILLIIYVARNKRPHFAMIVLLAFFLLVYFVYDREARDIANFGQKHLVLEKTVSHPIQAIETIWKGEDAAMCDYFSVMVEAVPDRIPFGNGSVVSDILLRAYPRFLWPGDKKPDEHMVHLFKVLFPRIFYKYTSGVAFSVIAELYADHGAAAIIIGMFFFGTVLALPKMWLKSTHNAIPAQLLYVSMPAYTISLMRGGIPAFVEFLAITTVPIALLATYAQARMPKGISGLE